LADHVFDFRVSTVGDDPGLPLRCVHRTIREALCLGEP